MAAKKSKAEVQKLTEEQVFEQYVIGLSSDPEVAARAKDIAAKRIADAEAKEAEARSQMAVELAKQLEAKNAGNARQTVLRQHLAVLQVALQIVAQDEPSEVALRRAAVAVDLAREMRLALFPGEVA
jgi:hypothetical protein